MKRYSQRKRAHEFTIIDDRIIRTWKDAYFALNQISDYIERSCGSGDSDRMIRHLNIVMGEIDWRK